MSISVVNATTPLIATHSDPCAIKMCRLMKKCGLVSAVVFAMLLAASPLVGLAMTADPNFEAQYFGRVWFLAGSVVSVMAVGCLHVSECDKAYKRCYDNV